MHKLTKILTAVTVSATLLAGTVPFISNAAPVMVQDTDTVETRFESSVPAVEEKPSARTDNLKGAVSPLFWLPPGRRPRSHLFFRLSP